MCKKTDFDAKTAEFDRRLLEFFEEWRSFVEQHRNETILKSTDWLEDFCSYVCESFVCFEELGRLNRPFLRVLHAGPVWPIWLLPSSWD